MIFGNLEYSAELEDIKPFLLAEVDWTIGTQVNEEFVRRNFIVDVIVYSIGNILYLVGSLLGIYLYFRNKRLVSEQFKLINFDTLTSLPNRRKLNKDVNKAIKSNKPFYLGFGDLDNFKNLNDILGHTVGDNFLRDITERLIDSIDDVFRIYRWGGDEFIFLIFSEDKQVALKYLDQLYMKIEEPIIINEAKYNIQISIGVVQYPRHGIT